MRKGLITLLLVLALVLVPVFQTFATASEVDDSVIEWQADITATGEYSAGLYVSAVATIGMAPDANADDDARDAYDAPLPPLGPNPSMQAYFDHPVEDFSRDVRQDNIGLSWDIDIVATFGPKPIVLTWDVSAVPAGRVVQLTMWTFNFSNGQWENPTVVVANMRTTAEYAYSNTFFKHDRFTVDVIVNQPPEATVTSPNGGEIVAGTIDVTATANDPDGTVAQVAFEYSGDGGTTWTAVDTDITSPYSVSWDTTGVADGDQYLVRATATDNQGSTGSDDSDAVFTVDNTAPAAPTLLLPADASFTNDTTPDLDWSDVTDLSGVTYDIQVDDNSNFSTPNINQTGWATSTYTTAPLAEGTYYWRARVRLQVPRGMVPGRPSGRSQLIPLRLACLLCSCPAMVV